MLSSATEFQSRHTLLLACALICLTAMAVLTGCAFGTANTTADTPVDMHETSQSSEAANSTSVTDDGSNGGDEVDAVLTGYAQSFSEGYAWVKYSSDPDESQSVYGCIDEDGKVQFYIPEEQVNMQPSPFKEGYSYLTPSYIVGATDLEHSIKTIGIVDKSGNVTKLGGEENVLVAAYGGGFTVLERHEEDFDSNSYTYEIYAADGKKVDEKKVDEETSVFYCGRGVFGFQFDSNEGNPTDFFCGKTGKWVHEPTSQQVEFVGDSDTTLLGVAYYDPEDTGYRMQLVFMTDKGDVSTYTPPDDLWNIWDAEVSDGKCVLHDFDGNYYVYDLASDSLTKMPEEYAEKIDEDYHEDVPACFHEGLCVMVAKGSDGDRYLEVFDANWEPQFDPIKIDNGWDYAYYFNGLLTAEPTAAGSDGSPDNHDTVVYDAEGNEVFGVKGYMSPCIDGVFLHAEKADVSGRLQKMGDSQLAQAYHAEQVINYLDPDGNPLFDRIDASDAEPLDISWEN